MEGATALPTEPQPLPIPKEGLKKYSVVVICINTILNLKVQSKNYNYITEVFSI